MRAKPRRRTNDGLVELLAVLQQLLHKILHGSEFSLVVVELWVGRFCTTFARIVSKVAKYELHSAGLTLRHPDLGRYQVRSPVEDCQYLRTRGIVAISSSPLDCLYHALHRCRECVAERRR